MTTAAPSLTRQALRFGLRIAGGYLVLVLAGLLFINLLKALLECRLATGIDLSCTLFGIDVGSPLVPLGAVVVWSLYAWPLVALTAAISFMLAAVFWLRARFASRGGA